MDSIFAHSIPDAVEHKYYIALNTDVAKGSFYHSQD